MPTVLTAIDHKLRVHVHELPRGAIAGIRDALSIPNVEREKARKLDQWGWQQMPEFIELYQEEDDHLIMPRGFLESYMLGIEAFGGTLKMLDERFWEPLEKIGHEVNLRPWQVGQVETLLAYEQGILKAPAGSGKTVAILAAIQQLGCNSLVIVNTKDILWQWQNRADQFLGPDYPVGQIGDNIFEVSPYLTIATAQTLHSRYADLVRAGFFDSFSFVALDECHHAQADTYRLLLDRFSARYRVGVSATPDKTGDFALATNVLGPIIHDVRPQDVTTLQRPVVIRVPTKFGYGFRGHKSRWQRSNYPQMIQAIIADQPRNDLIVDCISENRGHRQLVVTKRLDHIEVLHSMLEDIFFPDRIMTLVGQDSNEHRQEVVERAEEGPIVILSTLADEALDIPVLDRLHLVFPQRNPGLITQQVGRVERRHPDKADAKIYDYVDANVGPLENQWRTRRTEVYGPRGYKVVRR